MIGKVTFVSDLKTISTNNSQYTQPLLVRTVEVKWFAPRSSAQGVYAGIEHGGFELRNQLASDCRLQPGDFICFDYDISSARFIDKDQHETCASRLIMTRYAYMGNWEDLK